MSSGFSGPGGFGSRPVDDFRGRIFCARGRASVARVLAIAWVSAEALQSARAGQPCPPGQGGPPGPGGRSATPTLDQLGRNLTAMAREGQIDPVIGRDGEIEQTVEVLSRRG